VLADQDFAGWRASVNGVDTPILRATYAVRAVPVPAGHALVRFRVRPSSVVLGAALSALSIAAALALLWQAGRRGW
jgi:hypothetical protein